MPRALITGITGQDGSYLAEWLLAKHYEVHGTTRSLEKAASSRIAHLLNQVPLHVNELRTRHELEKLLQSVAPGEIYHLAGQSDVRRSFEIPEETTESIAMGTLRLLEAARQHAPGVKLFLAGSSEIFGRPALSPQNEETPMAPVNPYGCAKAFARQIGVIYRNKYNLFACGGIFYNHESPRRGDNFVTRKICRAAARIKRGEQHELFLGDTSAQRDWGHAKDFVRGMWLALRHETPEDYIFATGQAHAVQDVVEIAFAAVELDWKKHVRQDPALVRPPENHRPLGDASKARRLLGWTPEISFDQMIREMTLAELDRPTCPPPI
jgi:GDPmannose 4,6-dehydratase